MINGEWVRAAVVLLLVTTRVGYPMRAVASESQATVKATFTPTDAASLRRKMIGEPRRGLNRLDAALQQNGFRPLPGKQHVLSGVGTLSDGRKSCSFVFFIQEYRDGAGGLKALTHTDTTCGDKRSVRSFVLARLSPVEDLHAGRGAAGAFSPLFMIDDAYKDQSDRSDSGGGGGTSVFGAVADAAEWIWDAPWCSDDEDEGDADCLENRPRPEHRLPTSISVPPGFGDVLKCYLQSMRDCFF